jgi:hypothetical protein
MIQRLLKYVRTYGLQVKVFDLCADARIDFNKAMKRVVMIDVLSSVDSEYQSRVALLESYGFAVKREYRFEHEQSSMQVQPVFVISYLDKNILED